MAVQGLAVAGRQQGGKAGLTSTEEFLCRATSGTVCLYQLHAHKGKAGTLPSVHVGQKACMDALMGHKLSTQHPMHPAAAALSHMRPMHHGGHMQSPCHMHDWHTTEESSSQASPPLTCPAYPGPCRQPHCWTRSPATGWLHCSTWGRGFVWSRQAAVRMNGACM